MRLLQQDSINNRKFQGKFKNRMFLILLPFSIFQFMKRAVYFGISRLQSYHFCILVVEEYRAPYIQRIFFFPKYPFQNFLFLGIIFFSKLIIRSKVDRLENPEIHIKILTDFPIKIYLYRFKNELKSCKPIQASFTYTSRKLK